VPAVPGGLIEPMWAQVSAVLPDHPHGSPTHPLGCPRPRVPDRVVVDHIVAALVHGSGYERIATPGWSDRTMRRRMHHWADAGWAHEVPALVLAQDARRIGLDLADVAVDGCIPTAPGGGDVAGRSPVDRGKQGLNRSTMTAATGVPLHLAGANRHDAPLLGPTLAGLATLATLPSALTVHLDRGSDSGVMRALLDDRGVSGEIAPRGVPAPLQVGNRWVVDRPHAWMHGYGNLRRCPETTRCVVEVSLVLAAAVVVTRCLIQRARTQSRWPGRPTTRRLT
jgi:hypothetical protein